MAKKIDITVGSRVGFTANFCKSIGAYTGRTPFIKGKFLGQVPGLSTHGYVKWDDTEERIAGQRGNFSEKDYCDHVRENGEIVALVNIAVVGSSKFYK